MRHHHSIEVLFGSNRPIEALAILVGQHANHVETCASCGPIAARRRPPIDVLGAVNRLQPPSSFFSPLLPTCPCFSPTFSYLFQLPWKL